MDHSGGGHSDSENWKRIFRDFEQEYKKAYYSIDNAIRLDEEGKVKEALPLYELGLSLIDKILSQALQEPSSPDILWEKAVVMMQKLRKTRKEILIRLENFKSNLHQSSAEELPPSYEEVFTASKPKHSGTENTSGNIFQKAGTSNSDDIYIPPSAIQEQELLVNLHSNKQENSDSAVTYSDLAHQLKEMKLAKNQEILFRCDNAQLYFIAPDGRVSSTTESHTLIIAKVYDESMDQFNRTFLQVGSWVYPLIPDVSPCIRSEYGAFILPDINAGVEGAAVGIIVPEEVADELHELFASILNDISNTSKSRMNVAVDFASDKFSSRIARGAAYLAHNLVRGAGSTARFLDSSTPKIIDRINPSNEPQQINPALQKTVEVAKIVSGKAVDVTDYLATKICVATSALGRYLSPHIQKQGTRILASTTHMSEEEASKKINSVLDITSEALEGISIIYSGLDTAASILARSLTSNTVQIIEYKYGQPAGALTNDAITTFGNVYYAHHNSRVLRPKGIAKATIRGAGQALLEEHQHSKTNLNPVMNSREQELSPAPAVNFLPERKC